MEPLQNIDLDVLVDMLANYTDNFSKMLSEGGTEEEFQACKKQILDIQTEIEARRLGNRSSQNINLPGGKTKKDPTSP